jgi:signal transduction histidine kinase
MYFHVFALVASATIALWVAARVSRGPSGATRPFLLLSSAIAVWCAAGAGHALADTLTAKLVWAKLQYLGIASAAPLWLLFTAEYAGRPWFVRRDPARVSLPLVLLWVIPVITLVMAATNEWHYLLWSSVALTADGRAIYSYGPWFAVAAAYSYVLLLTGTLLALRVYRQAPPPLRRQGAVLLVATLIPWVGNILYLTGSLPPGIDVTPISFAASSLIFAWARFRHYLFDLVPVARDQVIDSLSDEVVVIDASRRIIDMNAAARALAGRKATIGPESASWIGRDVATVFPLLAELRLQPGSVVLTSSRLKSGGEAASFDVRVLPVHWRGTDANTWIVLMRDVTALRRAAAERELLQQRVQEQQRREGLSILAAGLAHDFNNLLAGVTGHADLLALQLPPSSKLMPSVGAILLGAQRGADLVAKMLAYAGERHGSSSQFDVDELVSELLELLRASAARHCTITYVGDTAVIDADRTQFRQVAMNLVINAAEAVHDEGNITVTTGHQLLTAAALSAMQVGQDARPGEYAFLDVRDDGVGIDEATMGRIFQPFFTTKARGHGLGLAAVQGIVLGHRGALKVESQVGRGSRFTVWFPLAAESDVVPESAITPHPGTPIPAQDSHGITHAVPSR